MVAHTWEKPTPLVVTFERTDEEPVRVEAPDGEKAILQAVKLLLLRGRLQPGDRLTVEAAQ
jgi:hypothetical protein